MRFALLISWFWLALFLSASGETLPPKPADYFNDYAHIASPATARRLDQKLRQFERDTSNQVTVAIFRHMDSSSSIDDYTRRVAQSWKVGQADRKNGTVLFVYIEDRKMFIQVGYGLEGALPDILCKQIIENEITPQFKAGHYDAGLSAGVDAILKATRREYRGTGKVHGQDHGQSAGLIVFLLIFFGIIVFQLIQGWRNGTVYSSGGRRYSSLGGGGYWGMGGGGGGFGGGGGGSGGDSGFSGGGGTFGGGGAGGSW